MEITRTNKINAHLMVLVSNIIFGLGIPITKSLLSQWVTPMGYMLIRCLGSAVIFWGISLFLPKEKVAGKDLAIILLGGLLGIVISQTLTAWALVYTTPVYYSLIATLTPVATLLLSAIFLNESMNKPKFIGVSIGIIGALLMVYASWSNGSGTNDILGIGLTILSLLTWVIYLIITRKVSQRYTAVTQMKWVFLVSTLAVLPMACPELGQQRLLSADWAWSGVIQMGFIVVFATVMGYFAIPAAMHYLQATTVSVYTNLQPIVASFIAIMLGQDLLTIDKPVALALVLISAYMVNKKE